MKALFVSMPPTYDYENHESRKYRKLREEYFTLYTILRTNKTLRNVDADKLPYIDNLHNTNYALLSFIPIAKKEGVKTRYFAPLHDDEQWLDNFNKEYDSFRPDTVYIGCSHSTSFNKTRELIKNIKIKNKDTRIIIGGQYLTGLQQPIEGATVVQGDGFLPFYWTLISDEPLKFGLLTGYDVPEDVKREFRERYEEFPYPDIDSYNLEIMPVGRVYFQLGCINKDKGHKVCKFCGSLARKTLYLTRDIKRVISIIDEMVEKLKTQHIFLGDENFFSSQENSEKIIKALEDYLDKKGPVNLTFSIQTNLKDFLQSRKLVDRFVKIRLSEIHFGIESSSQKVIDNFGGKLKSENVQNALRMAKDSKVNVLCHFLIGLPGETEHSMKQDTRLIEELVREELLDFPEFRYVAYFPGMPFYQQASNFGIDLTEEHPERIVPEFEYPGFEIPTINQDTMVRLLHERYQRTNDLFREVIEKNNLQPREQLTLNKVLF